jgi:rhodanese-related sulfurtransferase
MDPTTHLRDYWPLLALALWFLYKWWNSRKVISILPALRQRGAAFIDVRTPAEFASASAPGSINIPLQELSQRVGEVSSSAPVVVACASGSRSAMARRLLKRKGYPEVYNIGNWKNFLA